MQFAKRNHKKINLFLGSHVNGVVNNLLNQINGNNSYLNYNSPPNPLGESSSLEYHLRETEQLLEISLLKKKLRETERAMEKIMGEMAAPKEIAAPPDHVDGHGLTESAEQPTRRATQVRDQHFYLTKSTDCEEDLRVRQKLNILLF